LPGRGESVLKPDGVAAPLPGALFGALVGALLDPSGREGSSFWRGEGDAGRCCCCVAKDITVLGDPIGLAPSIDVGRGRARPGRENVRAKAASEGKEEEEGVVWGEVSD